MKMLMYTRSDWTDVTSTPNTYANLDKHMSRVMEIVKQEAVDVNAFKYVEENPTRRFLQLGTDEAHTMEQEYLSLHAQGFDKAIRTLRQILLMNGDSYLLHTSCPVPCGLGEDHYSFRGTCADLSGIQWYTSGTHRIIGTTGELISSLEQLQSMKVFSKPTHVVELDIE